MADELFADGCGTNVALELSTVPGGLALSGGIAAWNMATVLIAAACSRLSPSGVRAPGEPSPTISRTCFSPDRSSSRCSSSRSPP